MASTDARPVPIKNTAFRAVFPIIDADGDLVTGATGLDSEVSKDQGAFADCTNEATEIATSSGMYYLDLTSTEMNADCVAVIVKTSSSGAKTTVLVFYPEETGDINVDVTAYGGTAGTFSGGRPEVNTSHIAGSAVSTTTAQIGVNVVQVSGDAAAADNAEAFFDGTGYAGTNNVIPTVTTVTNGVTVTTNNDKTGYSIGNGGISNLAFAAAAIDAAAIAPNAIGSSEIANNAITADKIATDAIDADALAANAVDEILDDTIGDGTLTVRQALRVMVAALAGKLSGAATTTITIRNVADTADVVVATVDANGNRSATTVTP